MYGGDLYESLKDIKQDNDGFLLEPNGTQIMDMITLEPIRRRNAILIQNVVYDGHGISSLNKNPLTRTYFSSDDRDKIQAWRIEQHMFSLLVKHPIDLDVLLDCVRNLRGRLLMKSLINYASSSPPQHIDIIVPYPASPDMIRNCYSQFWKDKYEPYTIETYKDHEIHEYGHTRFVLLSEGVCIDIFSNVHFPEITSLDELYHDGNNFLSSNIGEFIYFEEIVHGRAQLSKYMNDLTQTDPSLFIQELRMNIPDLYFTRGSHLDSLNLSYFFRENSNHQDIEQIVHSYTKMIDMLKVEFWKRWGKDARQVLEACKVEYIYLNKTVRVQLYKQKYWNVLSYPRMNDKKRERYLLYKENHIFVEYDADGDYDDDLEEDTESTDSSVSSADGTFVSRCGLFIRDGIHHLMAVIIYGIHDYLQHHDTFARNHASPSPMFGYELNMLDYNIQPIAKLSVLTGVYNKHFTLQVEYMGELLYYSDVKRRDWNNLVRCGLDLAWIIPEFGKIHTELIPELVDKLMRDDGEGYSFGSISSYGQISSNHIYPPVPIISQIQKHG